MLENSFEMTTSNRDSQLENTSKKKFLELQLSHTHRFRKSVLKLD